MNILQAEPVVDDMDEIIESGERLPPEMREPDMPETTLNMPIYNGSEVIDGNREED